MQTERAAFGDQGMQRRRGCLGLLLSGITKLMLLGLAALVLLWLLTVALNPWALNIGGRLTPLLYWHGMGTVVSKDGKAYLLYVSFLPDTPQGFHSGRRREGKAVNAQLQGTAWLCATAGKPQRMQISGTMYGGYSSTKHALLDFRIIEWRKPLAINYQKRGFFELAGVFDGSELVMNRPNEQGIKLNTGPFIDDATARFHWASYAEFEAACRAKR